MFLNGLWVRPTPLILRKVFKSNDLSLDLLRKILH
jgi:hypothetical protein